MTTAPAPAHWSADALAGIAARADARLPVFTAQDVVPILPDHDLWDMWQIAYADGRTALFGGRSWWFFWPRRVSTIPISAMTRRASA